MSVPPLAAVGIDFDNTLISYDDVMARLAVEWNLLAPGKARGKKQIRDEIRLLPDGEREWQRLQADVYGPRIHEGRLMEGARAFLEECKRRSLRIFIVSHKSRLAAAGDGRTDLRSCAREWMRSQGFFDSLALPENNVFFEPTRNQKVERIAGCGCDLFVDDLEETFLEPGFPGRVRKILYGSNHWPGGPADVECAATWNEISAIVFPGRDARPAR